MPTLNDGTIVNGRYTSTSIRFFDEFRPALIETIDFRDGAYIRLQQQFADPEFRSIQTGFIEAGTYSTSGNQLTLSGTNCSRNSLASDTFSYSATGSTLEFVKSLPFRTLRHEAYVRGSL